MSPLRKMRLQYAPIAWLVIVAILLLALAPHHYHLHHGSGPDAVFHAHEIDLHIFSNVDDEGHHDEAIVLEATPDALVKPFNDNPLTFILTVFLLALLPIVGSRVRHRLFDTSTTLRQAFYHLTPPLRAPPHL